VKGIAGIRVERGGSEEVGGACMDESVDKALRGRGVCTLQQ
jgi:hypothetical protein